MRKPIQSNPKAIFIIGPTASQKTSISLLLYRYLKNIEIISVDSGLIYRGMNIGTAKPNAKELSEIPHRLIDIRDPSEFYSAENFRHDALAEMQQITQKGKIPLLVGGTFFYFKALLEGLSPLPAADKEVRHFIQKKAEILGKTGFYQYLKKIDPISTNRIHINDFIRLSRALEVFLISGKTLTELITISGSPLPYRVYSFSMQSSMNQTLQHQRIENRFYAMLKAGFQEEVRNLFSRGDLHINMPSIRCIGYRQMWFYLSQEISYNEMVLRGIYATKQLYKRQMTWLKKWNSLHWLDDSLSAADIADQVKKIITNTVN